MGTSTPELLDVYQKQIRSVFEMAVPVWEPGLSKEEVKQLERVQKTAFHVILGEGYTGYQRSLTVLDCETLKNRRVQICLNFANKALRHPKYSSWFTENKVNTDKVQPNTRGPKSKPTVLKPVPHRTNRYRDSPLPYLTSLLNSQ